jgi:hypothetical protein
LDLFTTRFLKTAKLAITKFGLFLSLTLVKELNNTFFTSYLKTEMAATFGVHVGHTSACLAVQRVRILLEG